MEPLNEQSTRAEVKEHLIDLERRVGALEGKQRPVFAKAIPVTEEPPYAQKWNAGYEEPPRPRVVQKTEILFTIDGNTRLEKDLTDEERKLVDAYLEAEKQAGEGDGDNLRETGQEEVAQDSEASDGR